MLIAFLLPVFDAPLINVSVYMPEGIAVAVGVLFIVYAIKSIF